MFFLISRKSKPVTLEPPDRSREGQMNQVQSVPFGKPLKQKDVITRDLENLTDDAAPDTRFLC